MANTNEVKQYLACWFQLGKRVTNNNSQVLLPSKIFSDRGYSQEFENCWDLIMYPESGEWYLETTEQTVSQLLQPSWKIVSCARCSMPVAIIDVGVSSHICPCHDLGNWPNSDLPAPRIPVNSQEKLQEICSKVAKSQGLRDRCTD